jgi:hypothetical protein
MDEVLDERRMEIVHRLASTIARDATRAIQDANLDAQVRLRRGETGFELVIQSRLNPAQLREAEDIAEAVLESALLGSVGRLH